MANYIIRDGFTIESGFTIDAGGILNSIQSTSDVIRSLPPSLFRSIDFKTSSGMLGAVFGERLAEAAGAIVNPIEKGHPDVIPIEGQAASEEELRNYPSGIEIKTTIGNVTTGSELHAGDRRIDFLTGITWQAHHREVEALLGLVWDFADELTGQKVLLPLITGAFYANELHREDWGVISGTTGRNTKVTGMRVSGKRKMGSGWIAILEDERYIDRYKQLLGTDS